MTIDMILKNVLLMLSSIHVVGSEAETFAQALQNIRSCIDTIEKARKDEEAHENPNEQGQ